MSLAYGPKCCNIIKEKEKHLILQFIYSLFSSIYKIYHKGYRQIAIQLSIRFNRGVLALDSSILNMQPNMCTYSPNNER